MFQVIEDRNDLTQFATFLARDREAIRAALENTSAAAVIDPGAHDSGGGQAIISVANTAIEGFAHLPRRDQTERTWCARRWVQERKGCIFLPSRADSEAAIQAMQGVWLDSLVRWLLAAPIGSAKVLVLCDDSGDGQSAKYYILSRPRQEARNRLRHRFSEYRTTEINLRSRRRHGRHILPTTQIFLRTPDPETAEWASGTIGEHRGGTYRY